MCIPTQELEFWKKLVLIAITTKIQLCKYICIWLIAVRRSGREREELIMYEMDIFMNLILSISGRILHHLRCNL